MAADVQAFIDKQVEKATHKEVVMAALAEAKLAEWQGREQDAQASWQTVVDRGMAGDEGKAFAEMQALAEAYVGGHASEFSMFEQFVADGDDEQHGKLISLIGNLREAGNKELCAKLTMFELVRFERQDIGSGVHIRIRKAGV